MDYHGRLIGYECLLREHDADGEWRLPRELETLPLQRVIFLLQDTFKSLSKDPITLSINSNMSKLLVMN